MCSSLPLDWTWFWGQWAYFVLFTLVIPGPSTLPETQWIFTRYSLNWTKLNSFIFLLKEWSFSNFQYVIRYFLEVFLMESHIYCSGFSAKIMNEQEVLKCWLHLQPLHFWGQDSDYDYYQIFIFLLKSEEKGTKYLIQIPAIFLSRSSMENHWCQAHQPNSLETVKDLWTVI